MSTVKEVLHTVQREHPEWFEQSNAPEFHEDPFDEELAFAAEMEAAQQQPHLWLRKDIPTILWGDTPRPLPPNLEREVLETAAVLARELGVDTISYQNGAASVTFPFEKYRNAERIADAMEESWRFVRERGWVHCGITMRYGTSNAVFEGNPRWPEHTAHTITITREGLPAPRTRLVKKCRQCGFEGATVNGFAFGPLCYECASELY